MSKGLPCFVISLPGSDRRNVIGPALDALGMGFTFVDGVDGRRLGQPELAALHDAKGTWRQLGRAMWPGEIGCALSHQRVYRHIVEAGIETAMVLEDDGAPTASLAAIQQAGPNCPADFDILSFYAARGWVERKPGFEIAGVACHRATTAISHAVGYLIQRSAAEAILAANPRVTSVADWPPATRPLRFYAALPSPVGHSETGSILAAERREGVAAGAALRKPGRPRRTGAALARLVKSAGRRLFPGAYLDLSTQVAQPLPDPGVAKVSPATAIA